MVDPRISLGNADTIKGLRSDSLSPRPWYGVVLKRDEQVIFHPIEVQPMRQTWLHAFETHPYMSHLGTGICFPLSERARESDQRSFPKRRDIFLKPCLFSSGVAGR